MSEKVEFRNTSFDEGFGIFKQIADESFDVVNENNLKLFMLETENKLFSYDQLYDYVLHNVARYVFNRKKISETESDPIKQQKILFEAIDQLKSVESKEGKNTQKGAGAELGEILLYLFLEQDMRAPKLLSKFELKTNPEDYVKGSDAIHFRFKINADGKKIMQLVVGEAKIYDKIKGTSGALQAAFNSIKTYIDNSCQERALIDTHLMNQFVDAEEAAEIKSFILAVPRPKRETVFGIFIGYTSPYNSETDSNDVYDQKIVEENKQHILSIKQDIINEISRHNISNYQFNFYFLPFHNAAKDRKHIMGLIKKKETRYTDRGRLDE